MLNKVKKFPGGIELVCSALIEDSQGRILVARSPSWSNKWVFPGGHIKPGETIKQAVLREVKEETGLRVEFIRVNNSGQLINSADFHRPAHFIYFDVYCRIKGNNLSPELDQRELTDYQWLSPKAALKLDLAESFDQSIKVYLRLKKAVK